MVPMWARQTRSLLSRMVLLASPNAGRITAFLLPFLLYLFSLAPTIYNLDSAELTTAAATLGLTRSTGYPFYVVVGHLWSKIPIGDVGYRLNLFSAVNGALTIFLVALILQRLGVGAVASFGALGLLATSRFFWGLSLIAEVYTLQTALMAGQILCLVNWQRKPTSGNTFLVGLLIGLGLCHHGSQILLLPAIGIFLLFSLRSFSNPKSSITGIKPLSKYSWLAGFAGLFLGLSFLLYLPLRYLALPAFNYAGSYDAAGVFHPLPLNTLSGLFILVSGKPFSNMMFSYSPGPIIFESNQFIGNLWRSFLIIGIGPGILGIFILFRRNLQAGIMLVLMFVAHVCFFVSYRAIDKELMFLPAYLVWTIWLGLGYETLLVELKKLALGSDRLYSLVTRSVRFGFQLLMIGGVIWSAVYQWPLVNQSADWSTRQSGEEIMGQVEKDSLIFGYWDVVPSLQYLQLVEGQRPDLKLVNRFLVSQDNLASWIMQQIDLRPIYVDGYVNGLPSSILLIPEGQLYRLTVAPAKP
jgi:hypothetical protein